MSWGQEGPSPCPGSTQPEDHGWRATGAPDRVRAIDREALTRLYRDYGPVVHRRARTLLGSDEEARDAMQEVFMRVYQQHASFSGEVPILRWIYRITTNLCLNRLRQRRAHPVVQDPDAVRALLDGARDPVDRRAILQVLAKMDPLTQQIAIYYHVDGMKMEEVAEVVGYSRKTVGKKLDAFRSRARRLLEAGV